MSGVRSGARRLLVLALVSVFPARIPARPPAIPPGIDLAIRNCILIDGTGSPPVRDAVLLIGEGRVLAAGPAAAVGIPPGSRVLDLDGAAVLPGFVNAHVHYALDEERLARWLESGVTSVRDMSSFGMPPAEVARWRARTRERPDLARLYAVGPMITVPGGYGSSFVSTPAEARAAVDRIADAGLDAVKASLEDGYAGVSGLPQFDDATLDALVAAAKARGLRVTMHVTEARFLRRAVLAGVDELAHIAWDRVDPDTWRRAVSAGILLIPTFSVFRSYGAPVQSCVANLRAFRLAGGRVALGNDYGGGPGEFEGGIPMFEIECMLAAGMTPMEVITACTRTSAEACAADREIGTLEPGKLADLIVVRGDPLSDPGVLRDPVLVMKEGRIAADRR
ncbi:MAG TPA: amidohydrolase family protein [Spirochaetia bacterium]|nr:amidohydrolase family protein [Spirochaetales bacterium]HRY79811.1 amidohydrolase family protein [Spirochaetia bacterium]HRZ89730.1 amidohydrolase family protein [Spirochaetia bacterium]